MQLAMEQQGTLLMCYTAVKCHVLVQSMSL